jgi:raffinose/stachyose/melibiose transport system permease protein
MTFSLKYKIVVYSTLIFFALITIMPLIWLCNLSFKTNTEIITGNILHLPKEIYYQNYIDAWFVGSVNKYFINSVIVTGLSSIITVVIGLPMAYGITRLRWKLSSFVLTILLCGVMIPIHATLIPIMSILKWLKMLNSRASLVFPYVASTLPITVYIVRSFLINIPIEMEEAACIDGCGVVRSFLYIITPTIAQSIVVVVTLNFMTYWNEFVMASSLVTNPVLYTLPIGLRRFSSDYVVNYGAIAAGVFISLVPVLLLYLLFTNQLEKGMVAGALK